MNIKSGRVEQFGEFSQFGSLQEFNHHMEMWLVDGKKNFTKAELIGLKRLVRFAAKIPGVCNAKIGTVLMAIYEELGENGISRSSFKRMIQKAIKLGLVTVHETERKNGSQSSNLYVFNRYPQPEPPKEEKLDHHNKTNNLLETKKENNINKRKETATSEKSITNFSKMEKQNQIHQPQKATRQQSKNNPIPTAFHQMANYFYDIKTINEFWRMTKIAAYKHNCDNDDDKVLEIAIHSFKELISKLKSNTTIRKPVAYFYSILSKKFNDLYIEDLFDNQYIINNEDVCIYDWKNLWFIK
jgi:hypothetical protein